MKGILALFFLVLLPFNTMGAAPFLRFEDIQNQPRDNTECATGIFANALAQTANTVSEYDDEQTIQQWIYATFSDKAVLERVLACPEIANADDNDTIKFMPIQYIFPGGREIVINYETQPKILKQRIRLADKRGTPSSDPNPRIGADDAVWTNIDPAWYAIMVTEHGALNNFVGPDKNNTISLDYIKNNIDSLFPSGRGGNCTDRSAKSRDNTMINKTMRDKTVDIKDDTNDYYVAGDVSLQWLSYMEIALDVALTVVTMGGSQAITGITKAARASRNLKNLTTTIKQLEKIDTVTDYVKLSSQLDAAKAANNADEIADITKRMADLENADDNVKLFKQSTDAVKDMNKYLDALKAMKGLRKTKQTGNIIARGFKGAKATAQSLKAVNTGTKTLDKAAKIARKGMKTGRTNDWLFQSTMKNIGALGRLGTGTGILYGALKFVGGMYDWTETSTGNFTNNIDFAPLLLLSADDLQGQENVVNHGMWLMWAGDSTSPTDDDAAFLQAMDFASKFHEDLMENQNDSNSPCNIDIWVVKPIIRDPGTEHQALYYLVMNDVPWTTGE
ncbi:MAG: hypothetical protein IJD41_05110 [Alphaproteobacteria bacterium]|nr:hypothetical protein [Alphaproteobacteria bacterium]MBQ7127904.1 hypothetical protein [Alphaproteobacteria bacterium]